MHSIRCHLLIMTDSLELGLTKGLILLRDQLLESSRAAEANDGMYKFTMPCNWPGCPIKISFVINISPTSYIANIKAFNRAYSDRLSLHLNHDGCYRRRVQYEFPEGEKKKELIPNNKRKKNETDEKLEERAKMWIQVDGKLSIEDRRRGRRNNKHIKLDNLKNSRDAMYHYHESQMDKLKGR